MGSILVSEIQAGNALPASLGGICVARTGGLIPSGVQQDMTKRVYPLAQKKTARA
ncbi:hypothetical protein [Pseudomonas palleroniana]|uniref:hypothetical protein n=1 Tax=Pseudomonas palleroniana TaxID=191390 RepID=UPI001FD426DD|nr:hypothetical protein [Pseudomonas palleroniana]UOP08506.1 hypothetical protein LDL65_15470 [Pseudomonas palleroniana]